MAGPQNAPLGFERTTRDKIIRPTTMVRNAGGGNISTFELPKTGFLARLLLNISVTTAGTITTSNALGIASAIRRIRVTTNSGIDLYNVSGAGYTYLYQNYQELQGINGRQAQNQGITTPVTATSYNLDCVIPIQLNMHDLIGLVLLQNEQLQVILTIEWETDANVILTGGGTISAGTANVAMEFYTVPADKANYPPLNVIHQVIEDQIGIGATGDYVYTLPRGNTYLQILLGYGIAVAAADSWSRAIMRINQSDILYDFVPNLLTQRQNYNSNLTRGLGTIPFDLLGSDGLGNYGSARDFINSALLTDFQIVITATAATTLYSIRRMLLPLGQ